MKKLNRRAVLMVLAFPIVIGCESAGVAPVDERPTILTTQKTDFQLVTVIDTSGSFLNLFREGGRGNNYMMRTIDELHRERGQANDKIIISQISTGDSPILEGTTMDIRREFSSARALHKYISDHAGGASHLHDGIVQTIEYAMSRPAKHMSMCILSDMEDNGPDPVASRAKMIQTIAKYRQTGGEIVFNFVNFGVAIQLRQELAKAGMEDIPVESSIDRSIRIPKFQKD